ncbi:MAG: hypothetical protein Q8O67_29560 [Deltaproteobacteria bacterium]|nr:hypothetical protein [Deltaproteobacteria bacterium]
MSRAGERKQGERDPTRDRVGTALAGGGVVDDVGCDGRCLAFDP